MLQNKEEPIILCIETSGSSCSVAIGKGEKLLSQSIEHERNKAADMLPVLIESALDKAGVKMNMLQAIAVSGGPGSYTGLRIGIATAKGIAYAIGIPLIHIETFMAMKNQFLEKNGKQYDLYIPMMDARRMDAFYSAIDNEDRFVFSPRCETIDENSFKNFSDNYEKIVIIGKGLDRFKDIIQYPNIDIDFDIDVEAKAMVLLAYEKWKASKTENLAYFEPKYYKAVHLSKKNA
ncbi:MAG: tRNA (adenosine(37)-N6)-threonylcarbamoyltransferase complex dimerization subunit type 1 TsaB [Chitinophagales bacterium]|nr:tRNA (adenosine(37)-N6)-threonylcarbamoyltransferase complex dimerization subunit type 1 TsaB [Chitinophagales bacterium]MCZ2394237.1 tRNA (adenosine(37)-N6)-threonylcarbamoyltransferase complex dimerization subunit type 1 TsaB [Chitinophagales bacterium]